MMSELKRAVAKKSNITLVIVVIFLMSANAYFSGWNTALGASSATDLSSLEDVIFYQKYFGNVYRVWSDSYVTLQALAPVILVIPYLSTYLSEKVTSYRYLVVSREGNFRYVVNKVLAIALSGTIILAGSELLFGVITSFLTSHDTSPQFMEYIVTYKESFFLDSPLLYFVLVYVSHVVYYFSFVIFAVGITSFLKNRIAVIITPFIVVALIDMVLPTSLQSWVVMQPFMDTFSISGYGTLVICYIIFGIILTIISEKIYLRRSI